MRVGGIVWGRRPPSAGGGPMLRRRPARRAGRRQNFSPFIQMVRFLIANGGWPPPIREMVSLMGCRGERFYFSQWVVTAAALPTALRTGSRLDSRAIEVQKNFEGL
jgi:hypothetical protein